MRVNMCPTCVSERCEAEERDGRDLNTYDLRLSTDRPTYYSYIVPTYLPTSNTKVGSLDYYTFFITYFIVLLIVLLSITTHYVRETLYCVLTEKIET